MIKRSATSVFLAVLFLFTLNACGSLSRISQENLPFSENEAALAAQTKWRADGKLSINHRGKRQTVSFQWQQHGDDYSIHMFGPFGQGSTWLRRTDNRVTLESAKYGKQQAKSAEALLTKHLGWQLPIGQLVYWIRGIPAPQSRSNQALRHQNGALSQILQKDWRVDFVRHQTVRGWHLPEKIRLDYQDIQAIAVIKRWDLPEAPSHTL